MTILFDGYDTARLAHRPADVTMVITLRELPVEDVAALGGRVVYVGRATRRSKHKIAHAESPLANRSKGLKAYRAAVEADPALMAMLPALKGKMLACWCCITEDVAAEPDRCCHAEILADLIDGRPSPV